MKPKTKTTASLAVVGVDIGKEIFHLVGLGTNGTIDLSPEDQAVDPQRCV
jgi:hypothetical protein